MGGSSSADRGRQFAAIRNLRKENNAGEPIAYSALGFSKEVPGDEEGPFVKSPPFSSDQATIFQATLAANQAYTYTPRLNVEPFRTLTGFFFYAALAANGTGQLSIVPRVFDPAGGFEFSIGAIDASPSYVAIGAPFSSVGTPDVLSRTVMPSEFRTQAFAQNTGALFALQWDVSPYKEFAWACADLSDQTPGQLTIKYTYSM